MKGVVLFWVTDDACHAGLSPDKIEIEASYLPRKCTTIVRSVAMLHMLADDKGTQSSQLAIS